MRVIMLAIIPIMVMFLLHISTEKMIAPNYDNSTDRGQQQSIRGLCTIFIMLSHMLCNYAYFSNAAANAVLRTIFPSLVGMFFFYSGYGLMFKYKKGQNVIVSMIKGLVLKLAPAIIITYMLQKALEICFVGKSALDTISIPLGGWFTKTLFFLYFVFAIAQYISKNENVLLIVVCGCVAGFAVCGRYFGISPVYYLDCPAFLIGVAFRIYEKYLREIVSHKAVLAGASIVTILSGGGRLIIPSGMGLGLILYFIAVVSQCVAIQSFLSNFYFKKKSVLQKIGRFSYEAYLSGGAAKTIAVFYATSSISYYVIYGSLFMLFGWGIHSVINKCRGRMKE